MTSFTYDSDGRQVRTDYPGGYWVTNELNSLGQVVSTTDSAGTTASFSYNNQGLVTDVYNPTLGYVSQKNYDLHDRVIEAIDVNNVTVTNAYDFAGRLLATGTPDNGALQRFENVSVLDICTF